MEPTLEEQETDFLQALRNEYEGRGYSFHIHPDNVPKFLGSYRPDAIATSPKESIVIEVKARRQASNEPRLSEIARLMEKQPGWKLKIYYRAGTTPRLYDTPAKEIVIEQSAEAERLFSSGHPRAAFVMAWAALEAAARAVSSDRERARVMMPRELVEWLSYGGHIPPSASRQLRDLITVRNAIVHGASEVIVERGDFTFLQSILQSLINEIKQADR
jgi:uncharacterized protein YutE (UPF0331/DUF86 family)